MKNFNIQTIGRTSCLLLLMLLSITTTLKAQNVLADLPKNQVVPLVNNGVNFSGVTVAVGEECGVFGCVDEFGGGAEVINSNLFDFSYEAQALLGDYDVLQVNSPVEFPAGTFAGFRFTSGSLLSLFGGLTIERVDKVT